MAFVQFYLTQPVLAPTMKKQIVLAMRRVGTMRTHHMSGHPLDVADAFFNPCGNNGYSHSIPLGVPTAVLAT